MRIIIVRHGDTNATEGVFHNWKDYPLSSDGIKEAKVIAPKLDDFDIEQIYSSDMSRTAQTAKIIEKEVGATMLLTKKLRPWNLGAYGGQKVSKYLPEVKYYISNPNVTVPQGESFSEFVNRYLPFFVQYYTNKSPETICFVTHGRNIMLTKAWFDGGQHGYNYKPATLLNNDISTEHGGYAIADEKGFRIISQQNVMQGQS